MEDDRRARARLVDADGTERDVTDRLVGADEFFAAWNVDADDPTPFGGSGWQRSDDAHPPGTGSPAYRTVYKTMRLLPWPELQLAWPNLLVRFAIGDVDRGGFTTPTAVAGRRSRYTVIPEHGRVLETPAGPYFLHCPDLTFELAAWEEPVRAVSYVEIIYAFDGQRSWKESDSDPDGRASADRYDELLRHGRAAVASLKALLDLALGPRLLAMPLTEEVGETFPDWHWNRRLDAGRFSAETQAEVRELPARNLADRLMPLIERQQDLPAEDRRRLRLASTWYWRAIADPDPVTGLLSWWLIIEALEMPRSTDIRPVRLRLAELLGTDEDRWRQPVGRLFGIRSRLVHGELEDVGSGALAFAEAVARVLLTGRLWGAVNPADRAAALGVAPEDIA